MVKRKKTSKKKPGFKKVNFFSGLDTKTKKDDKQISFIARNLGKNSPLPRPKKVRALRNLRFDQGIQGIEMKQPKQPKQKLPVGIAEGTGISFDNVFGLGEQKGKGGLFNSKIGIDVNFGKNGFDTDFSKAFAGQEFDFSQTPTMIEDDFEDNPDIEANIEASANDDVPSLLESLPTIQNGSRPLDELEEEEEMSKGEKLEEKFLKVRSEALDTGANPLGPEEEANFAVTKAQRNFGTGSKGGRGRSFGRF